MMNKPPFGTKWCFTLSGENAIKAFEDFAETVPNEDVLCLKYQLFPGMTLRGCLQLAGRKRETQITKMLQQPTIHLKRTLMWDKALEYVNEIEVPIKEFGSYKDHAEKIQMGILKKKNNTVEGIPTDRDERLMEFTNMLTNSSNIENTKLTIFKSMPSIVGELSICEQYALKQRRQETLQQRQIKAHEATLYEWQREIEMEINRKPDERIIFHYVDPKGGKGKTFIQKNLKDKYPERIFQFIDGKATDVYHQLHKHQTRYGQAPSVIFYNITRFQYNQGQENFINYSAIEDIKDGLVTSLKYDGGDVFFENNPHVYIFSNQNLEYRHMSLDRWRKRTFIQDTESVKTTKLIRIKKKEEGFTYTWQDLYCTDDHIKELSLIPPIQYKGTLDVTPLSSASLYKEDLETSESDDDLTSTISTDTSERTSDRY